MEEDKLLSVIAKKAKGYGFNCIADNSHELIYLTLLQEWLRKEHDIYVAVLPYKNREVEIEFCFYYSLVVKKDTLDVLLCDAINLGASIENFDNYQKALESGLLEGLQRIKFN